ncbi:MAG TPA: excinuclease ABC subunit A [Desulfobacteraceae bacterium]|nr:excinuclease ABC subunit A [Desulfobacteraceae bacterium]
MSSNFIRIRGARQHNLKGISVDIPRNSLVVITGVSGSGKSSLAFDTIYAEGQRRYVESISAYARRFLEKMDKPDADSIEGLSPAIAIGQRTSAGSPRSTVGTVTEIHDYLRVLYAAVGVAHCPDCGVPITSLSVQEMVDNVMHLPAGAPIQLLAPVVEKRRGTHGDILKKLTRDGYTRVSIDGDIQLLEGDIRLNGSMPHSIDVVIDRLIVKEGIKNRLTDSLELALSVSGGRVRVNIEGLPPLIFNRQPVCPVCGLRLEKISPGMFSFNSPHGACTDCGGLGTKPLSDTEGTASAQVPCSTCLGARLKRESLAVKVGGQGIHEVTALSVKEAGQFFSGLDMGPRQTAIASKLLKEILGRLGFISSLGLDYLTIDRKVSTLSGGEDQRIRLATQIGSGLAGVLYVLDEPSIGLHPKDNLKLLESLKKLRDLGNTVLVVEHDEETIRAADHIVDIGPGAGEEGGRLLFSGPPEQITSIPESLTGRYLSGASQIALPALRRQGMKEYLRITGACEHNLKNISVDIPLGTFTCVTGVSGSGKSSLINDIVYPFLNRRLNRSKRPVGRVQSITGEEHIEKVINIDQTAIGRTPKSNPATYTGIFDDIRKLFAILPESRRRGYRAGRFSFNVRGGRCEACKGDGVVKIEMHFLPDVYVKCDSCNGRRYNRDTLEVKLKGFNIADVLNMTVAQALGFFESIPPIRSKLLTLTEVGLGYLKLGQQATTLSGGEAQRIKLAKELGRKTGGRTLYLLDEPTTGLHPADIDKLLQVLNRLVQRQNTVIVIEHHLDVIKTADYIIDLGPGGGDAGGRVVASGTPEEIARAAASHTGVFLRKMLEKHPGGA